MDETVQCVCKQHVSRVIHDKLCGSMSRKEPDNTTINECSNATRAVKMVNLVMVMFAFFIIRLLHSSAEGMDAIQPSDSYRYCPEGVENEELTVGQLDL